MAHHFDLTLEDDMSQEQEEGDEAGLSSLQQALEYKELELQKVERQIRQLLERQQVLQQEKADLARRLQAEQHTPRMAWSSAAFSWDSAALQLLQDTFGLPGFRPLQREVVNASMQGRDVMVLLPSGGGKSLCYQLPALLGMSCPQQPGAGQGRLGQAGEGGEGRGGSSHAAGGGWQPSPGLTVVISPLLSLIQDQVSQLHALLIPAACLTSLSSKEETNAVFARLTPEQVKTAPGAGAGAGLRLLYVTPERVVASKRLVSKLEKLYEAGCLARVAVDEAHCASQWGNDFRPDYKKLGVLRTLFPRTPILALTATATHQVRRDVAAILNTPAAELFSASINRPNLFYEVAPKPALASDATAALAAWIQSQYPEGESGIVYALTRKDCETLAGELQAARVCSVHYHADMEPCARQAAHQAWAAGRAQVIVATVAFGMGINKPDVRFVVHASLSKSVENYYQESGRAGRDGLFARCLLFYRFSDALRQAAIVCYEPNWWSHLSAMARYASSLTGCRRAALQAHFAESPAPCLAMCDCCSRQPAAPCSRTAAAAEGRGTAAAAAAEAAGTEAEADGGREAGVGGSCPGGQQGGGGAGGGRLQQQALVLQDVGGEVLSALKALHQLRTGGSKKVTLVQLMAGWRKADKAAAKRLSREQQEQVVEAMLLRWEVLELEFGATAYATNVYLKPSSQGQALWQPGDPEPCMEGKFCMHFRPDMEEGGAVEGRVAQQQQQEQEQQQRGVDQGKGDVALQAGASGVVGEGEVLPSGRQGGKRSGSSSRGGKGVKQQRKEGGGVQAPGEVVWVDSEG